MRISDTSRLTLGSSTGKTSHAGDGGVFSSMLHGAVTASNVAAPSAPLAPAMASLLAMQEVPEEEQKRRKLLKRGALTLDGLENIRQGLLTGSISQHNMREMEYLVKEAREENPDPVLNELLDDIELRAAVELAKLGIY